MSEQLNWVKRTAAAAVGALTALWGWFGWFCVLLALCMALDYVTGTLAAKKSGTWSSDAAREGLWHKLSILVAVLAACILDVVVGMLLTQLPAIELPFSYSVLFGPLVTAWYVITELGSILENAGALGAPQPKWFRQAISALQSKIGADEEAHGGEE